MPVNRPRAERGSGTVLVAGLAAVLILLLAALVLLVQGAVGGARAAAAADLAALAGADAARGLRNGDPCDVARGTARRHRAELVDCLRSGPGGVIVTVRTSVPVPGILPPATGAARAGPPPQRARPPPLRPPR
ncbi:Rv3654c family TadE-like protein [Arthrobacter zhaoguopingii]|uniref:Rv3654c family TadE-like protein n=1 Tax=Arthrobacter zhaoguopingii TaxID=2681491 RepID=UPI001359B03A|nr:Rv3654c family TadE-like protein [Arthrobacter zhaoguopingii]